MSWVAPPVTDKQLRDAGYDAPARQYPLSEAGARWVAAYNNIPFDKIPPGWCYAPNPGMLAKVERWAKEQINDDG